MRSHRNGVESGLLYFILARTAPDDKTAPLPLHHRLARWHAELHARGEDQLDDRIGHYADGHEGLADRSKVDPNHWTGFCRFLASEILQGLSLVSVTQE